MSYVHQSQMEKNKKKNFNFKNKIISKWQN